MMCLKNIYKFNNEDFINELENIKTEYVDNAYKVNNSFCSSFYALLAEFSAIDAKEFFIINNFRSNIFKLSAEKINSERKRRFFKIIAMHHTIQMLAKKKDKLDFFTMSIFFYKIYSFEETEKQLFEILYKYRMEFPKQFPAVFARTAIKYIFGSDNGSAFFVAFFQNFCYNSFKTFVKYFSEYISINRRIKISNINDATGA